MRSTEPAKEQLMPQTDKKNVAPEKARALRAKRRQDSDEEDQQLQEDFEQNPQAALQKIDKEYKESVKSVEKQVKYFGHVMEPFSMKNDDDLGEVDKDGFFVFKKKNKFRDAWLDSLQIGDDEQLLQGIQKNILKTKKIDGVLETEEEEIDRPAKKQHLNDGTAKRVVPEKPKEHAMTPQEIKYLLSQLLPSKMHCAGYMKQLKPAKKPQFKKNVRKNQMVVEESKPDESDLQEHQRILQLCNMYIEQTGDHDIMTKTKEVLSKQVEIKETKKDEDDIF